MTSMETARGAIDAAYRAVCALGIGDADSDCRQFALNQLIEAQRWLTESETIRAAEREAEAFRQWKAARNEATP